MSDIKLDIGCGNRPKEGWIGLDIVENEKLGVNYYDMVKDRLPYETDSVDAIRCINTLEHIERKYYKPIFNDWWECLKIDGTLEIIVPNIEESLAHAWGDITHLSAWTKMTFRYLSGERPRYADYGYRKWEILQLEPFAKEKRDLHAILTPLIDRKSNLKYGRR